MSAAVAPGADAAAAAAAAADPFPRKHPLETGWALWAGEKSGLRPLHTFDTVEDFWCLHANLKPPSALPPPATLALFRAGIEPKWEDPANANGGCWVAVAPRAPNANTVLDQWWLQLVR